MQSGIRCTRIAWRGVLTIPVAVSLLLAGTGHARTADGPATIGHAGERRAALVIGNDAYSQAPLNNAVRDAKAIADALTDVGFDVVRATNVDFATFERAVADFAARVNPGDVALFFYSGHGMQVEGENYLIPVGFAGTDEADVKARAYSVSRIHDKLEKARLRVVVLDACRDNPFRTTRALRRGLAEMSATGSLIAFATGPGGTASDNPREKNGLFTKHLLAALAEPGLTATELFRRVRARVNDASGGRQVPWLWDGVIGDFIFRPGTPAAPAGTPAASNDDLALRAELALWESIKDSESAGAFEQYLKEHPSGRFRIAAQAKLATIRDRQPASPAGNSSSASRRLWITVGSAPASPAGDLSLRTEFERHVPALRNAGIDARVVLATDQRLDEPDDFVAVTSSVKHESAPVDLDGVSMRSCRTQFSVSLRVSSGRTLLADQLYQDTAVGGSQAAACSQALSKAVRTAVTGIVQSIRKG